MEDSILNTVKNFLLGTSSTDVFDAELIILINASFSALYQFGVSKDNKPFKISGETEKWSDVISSDDSYENAKEYVCIDVKIVFDPPTSSFVLEALKEIRKECAWRIAATTDLKEEKTGNE